MRKKNKAGKILKRNCFIFEYDEILHQCLSAKDIQEHIDSKEFGLITTLIEGTLHCGDPEVIS